MKEEVLFEITKDKLETGMRGFPVGYCPTSTVDPQKGLSYMGCLISELAGKRPEEVIYLIMHGKAGSSAEVKAYFSKLSSHASLKKETVQAILRLPRQGHPIKLFSAALLIVGMFENEDDYRLACERLIAKIPHIAALVINHHAGWGQTPFSDPNLGYMENFTAMINVPGKNQAVLAEAFKLFNVLHYDHGGGNLSTFVGKAVASGLEDMYGSLTSAMCALAGPRHGKANQDCLEFIRQVLEEVGENVTAVQIEKLIRDRLANNQLIFGFGHAVLRVEDPRATVIYTHLKKHFPSHPLVKVALLLRSEGSKVLSENPKISNPHPNVDAISGSLLVTAGFDYPEYFTVLFGLSRAVGIARQIVYERVEARGGKGTPIVRPKYLYSGP
ncbi:MAG: citrate (Si)-synthase [Rhabdochlamydiaceae bacterium]